MVNKRSNNLLPFLFLFVVSIAHAVPLFGGAQDTTIESSGEALPEIESEHFTEGSPIDAAAAQEGWPVVASEGVLPNSQEAIAQGETLFRENCSVCHAVHEQVIGPALANVTDRRPIPWIIDFVHNSQKVIQSGDEYAVNLYKAFNKTQMPNFTFLSKEQIVSIMAYIQAETTADQAPNKAIGHENVIEDEKTVVADLPYNYLIGIGIGFVVVLLLIFVVLFLLISVFRRS